MKKIKFIISIIIFILVTGIFSSIYADDEATTTTTFTDFSNAKVIVTEKDDGNGYWSLIYLFQELSQMKKVHI